MLAATCAERFDIAGTTGTNCVISPSGFTVSPWAASAARNYMPHSTVSTPSSTSHCWHTNATTRSASPRCWRESNHRANGREYAYRRDVVRGALTDTRGARGRARAVRDAPRAGSPISEAVLAGLQPVHLDQIELFTDATNSSPGTTGPSSSTPPGKGRGQCAIAMPARSQS